ncbi:hypothetical protein GCM10020295_04220 [Streptomyces cinereospinus]
MLGEHLTLLVRGHGGEEQPFLDAARARGVPLTVVHLASSADRDYAGLPGARLALVRPDQVVGWLGEEAPKDAPALIDTLSGHTRAGAAHDHRPAGNGILDR